MILEVATLEVIPNREDEFELAFSVAKTIISRQKGFLDLTLHRCRERSNQYLLHVHWETIEDHTIGFRESADYQEWKKLLHHFYDPFPTVNHYEMKVKRQHGLMKSIAGSGYH